MARHVNTSVCLERHTLSLQQIALSAPPRSRAPGDVHHAMARQQVGSGRIAQCAPHHARVARPSCQCSNMPVGGHLSAGNLAHDVQHIIAKRARIGSTHLVGIVFHLPVVMGFCCKDSIFSRQQEYLGTKKARARYNIDGLKLKQTTI